MFLYNYWQNKTVKIVLVNTKKTVTFMWYVNTKKTASLSISCGPVNFWFHNEETVHLSSSKKILKSLIYPKSNLIWVWGKEGQHFYPLQSHPSSCLPSSWWVPGLPVCIQVPKGHCWCLPPVAFNSRLTMVYSKAEIFLVLYY